jgi:hypothetical protein
LLGERIDRGLNDKLRTIEEEDTMNRLFGERLSTQGNGTAIQ